LKGHLRDRHYLEEVGVDSNLILRRLKEIRWMTVDWIVWLRTGMSGGHETSGCIKWAKVLGISGTLLIKDSAT
jgi:hypothetical protein